ncbi:type IV toxin-antitoxin system AbiEi family antitoxin domain-containing protein [Acidovorax sp. JHL-3]|uniref:type IV toxin-antitoxin system AbiEi family antitoxin domain-containing protein n=1 Tax=Acidovorax sp. JHL-3 TaxID=1276755 RepID=UPI00046728AC|nr:type IV toxin-antitoxin system AbiEi family antitoxin domain-containing protein [Acidovorax sp. JHL-3]
MLPETHTQRILDLASQRGLLRASDLDAIGSPRVILTRMTAAGLLERVGRGLYRLPGAQVTEFESLALVCWRRFKIEPPCRLNFEPGLMANL